MAYLYLFLDKIFNTGQMLTNKIYQMRQRITLASYMLFQIVLGAVSTPVFFLMSGCDTMIDGKLLIYSFMAAVLVVTHSLFMLRSMAQTNMAVVTVVQNAGGLVIPALYGFLCLNEPVTLPRILSLVFVMAAFLIAFSENRYSEAKEHNTGGKLIYILLFATSGIGGVIPKAFTVCGSQASNGAYMTWVNVHLVTMVSLVFFLVKWRSKQTMRAFTSGIQLKNYIPVVVGSVFGCIASVYSMKAIAQMDIAIYSPLSSAMGMVFLLFVSRVIFKETISKNNILAAILGVVAVVCTVL